MGRPGLAVEKAAVAEIPAARGSGDRHDERLVPVDLRGQRRIDLRDLPALAPGPRLILRGELDVARLDGELRRRKIDALDNQGLAPLRPAPVVEQQGDRGRVLARRRIEIDAYRRVPGISAANERDLPLAPRHEDGLDARLVRDLEPHGLALRDGE